MTTVGIKVLGTGVIGDLCLALTVLQICFFFCVIFGSCNSMLAIVGDAAC